MSTNGTIRFIDKRGRKLLNIYNHYDSYYSGLGQKIFDFFSDETNYGNGFEDTILLFVCYLKKGEPYAVYATDEDDVQEYNYEIYETDKGLRFSVKREFAYFGNTIIDFKPLIRGTIDDFKAEIDKG